jgi:putative transcriptional regulator
MCQPAVSLFLQYLRQCRIFLAVAIEFDPAKDAVNIDIHGISLAMADRLLAGLNGMSIARPKATHKPDWVALKSLSDEEIAAQIAATPDAAPDVSDWPLGRANLVDVRAIRAKLGMSQERFARTFGITLAALRDWEQRRRAPRGPARTLLQIIDREPDAARRAMASSS